MMGHDAGFPCLTEDPNHDGLCRTPVSPEAAALLRQFGYGTPGPKVTVAESDLKQIVEVLESRMGEYFRTEGDGYRLNLQKLAVVVADVAVSAVKTDRRRAADANRGGGPDAA